MSIDRLLSDLQRGSATQWLVGLEAIVKDLDQRLSVFERERERQYEREREVDRQREEPKPLPDPTAELWATDMEPEKVAAKGAKNLR